MMAFSFRFPIVFLMLTMLPTCANVSASRGSAQEFPTTEPGARPTAGVTPVVSSDSRELWCNDQPVPRAADIPQLEGVEYSLIQARVPEVDGYSWLHGVALAWHRGQLYASFGRNRGEENTATEEAQLRISQDGGRSWGPVATIDVGPGENEAISHGVFLEHEMQLWALHGCFDGHLQHVRTKAYRRDDRDGTWIAQGVVAGDGFWPVEAPQVLPDGNWIVGGLIVGQGNPAGVAISHGRDLTCWDVVAIPKPAAMTMWGESTLLANGNTLLCIARYGEPRALTATSFDAGRTWTTLRESNLPMAASKPFAGLLSTGQRYLIGSVSADSGNRRSPLTIAVSRPGELGFVRLFRIRDAICDGPGESHPQAALSYPYAVEHNERLYVGYSNDGGRGGNRNSAELAIIPITSLSVD